MAVINIGLLCSGMIVSSDDRAPNGRLLLNKGITIEAGHKRILNMWGVSELHVEGPDSESFEFVGGERPFLVAAEEHVQARFAERCLQGGPEQELRKLAVFACEQRLADNWQETDSPPDACHPRDMDSPPPVEDLLKNDPSIASLPETYAAIRSALDDPCCTASRLTDIISSDVAMSTKLLRLANSPALGGNRGIDSLSRGVIVLGARKIGQLALTLTVLSKFSGTSSRHVSMPDMLKHSVACGVFAGLLVLRLNIREIEQFFVAGVLHDLGRLVLFQRTPDHAAKALSIARAERIPLWQAEQAVFGYDHYLVARHLLSRWGIPASLAELVAYHHSSEGASPERL